MTEWERERSQEEADLLAKSTKKAKAIGSEFDNATNVVM